MRTLLLLVSATVALAACGQKNTEALEPRDLTQVRVEGFKGLEAGKVATSAGVTQIPNEYRYLPLPPPSGKGQGTITMGLVPWSVFEKSNKPQPANITDLLALQSSPEGRRVLARYKRVCAPDALFYPYMPAITDGDRMGLYSPESCEWAIVVVRVKEKALNHVL